MILLFLSIFFFRTNRVYNTVSDVNEMVGYTLKSYYDGGVIRAHVNIAVSLGKSCKVAGNESFFLNVDTILQFCKDG